MIPRRRAVALVISAAALCVGGCDEDDIENISLSPGPTTIVGSGQLGEETREIGDVHTVALAVGAALTISQGDVPALTVRADDNILPLLESTSSNGTLALGLATNVSVQTVTPIEFDLTVTDLRSVTLAGSGEVKGSDLTVERLSLILSGSGSIDFKSVSVNSRGHQDRWHRQRRALRHRGPAIDHHHRFRFLRSSRCSVARIHR